jgi:competence protein ComEC
VVISHADVDHYNALPERLRRFSVGVVYVSPVMFDGESRASQALQRAIRAAHVPLREIHAGDRLGNTTDCTIEVLHPPARGTLGSDNSNSIVLSIECQGRRLLLPGDLESPGLDELLGEAPLDCDVVLAPHHGSAQSDPPGFASWATPEWIVVSGDRRANRSEVSAAYRARGARVMNTSQLGAVAVFVRSGDLQVSSWRAAAPRPPAQPATELAEAEIDP